MIWQLWKSWIFLFSSLCGPYVDLSVLPMNMFSDFCLALMVLIDESVPQRWIYREGFTHSRKLLILQWLLYGSVLLWGYKCVLLSTLIPIRYEQSIGNIYDLDKSELRFSVPDIGYNLLAKDPRSAMKRVLNKSDVYNFNGTIPQWVHERHCCKFHLLNICN